MTVPPHAAVAVGGAVGRGPVHELAVVPDDAVPLAPAVAVDAVA
jgi:hypothetical protein